MRKTAKLRKITLSAIMALSLTLTGCGKAKVETTDTVQWFNNTYAVLTVLNERDYRVYSGSRPNPVDKALAKTVLENSWSVTDRASADESFQWLLDEGHRVSMAEELSYLAEMGLADVPEDQRLEAILTNFDLEEQQAEQYVNWFALYEQYGENTAAAWDYSRAMWLLSYYYLADYYTEEEALDQSLALAQTIQTTVDSWDSFMESYFAGYEYWSEESSDERRKIYTTLKLSTNSPFSLDWNTPLEKTW